jgi:hypothetical protein
MPRFVIFVADQTNTANRNAGFTQNQRRAVTDMDANFYDLVLIYLIGGAVVFCMYAFFRAITI